MFRRRRDTASECLFDVDVLYTLVILVVFYVESNSSGFDDFPGYPTNALQAQYLVGIVTE